MSLDTLGLPGLRHGGEVGQSARRDPQHLEMLRDDKGPQGAKMEAAMETYRPEIWHDFFLMVGGGAAALAGLVFVSLSLNLGAIVRDATHRARAVGTLTGLTSVFILSGLALMGNQTSLVLGIEWLAATAIHAAIYYFGIVQSLKLGGSAKGRNWVRTSFATLCFLAQLTGSVLLILGYGLGTTIAATAMTLYFASLMSASWLLLVGICQDEQKRWG